MQSQPATERPVINIAGEKVALGPLAREYAPVLNIWLNDYAIVKMLDFLPGPRILSQTEQLWDEFFAAPETNAFAIHERSTWKLVGLSVLFDIDHVNETAEFAIMIGDVAAQGRGYGTEATTLTLDHGFSTLGLRNIMLNVFAYNHAAIHVYQKLGFRTIGIRRQSKQMGGRFWDTIYMEMLVDEFESQILTAVLWSDEPE